MWIVIDFLCQLVEPLPQIIEHGRLRADDHEDPAHRTLDLSYRLGLAKRRLLAAGLRLHREEPSSVAPQDVERRRVAHRHRPVRIHAWIPVDELSELRL